MMSPRLSKEFTEVARLRAVSHSRGYAGHLFSGNPGAGVGRKNNTHHSPPARADLGAELVLIQAKLWQREACAVIRPERFEI